MRPDPDRSLARARLGNPHGVPTLDAAGKTWRAEIGQALAQRARRAGACHRRAAVHLQPQEYTPLALFRLKMAPVALGVPDALLHLRRSLATLTAVRRRIIAALSLALWPSVLLCGRLLACVRAANVLSGIGTPAN